MGDAALERRYNILSAQLTWVGVEVRNRWMGSSSNCTALKERLSQNKRRVKNRNTLIKKLEDEKKELARKKKALFRKNKTEVRENTRLKRFVAERDVLLMTLTEDNSSLKSSIEVAAVPEGMMRVNKLIGIKW